MRQVRGWFVRIRGLFRKNRWERRLAEELECHLQMHVDDGIRSGLTPEEARRQALLKLGGLEPTKEVCRDRHGIPWLETLGRDAAYAVQTMRRTPGFTVTVMLTLALGIGATTAVFTVVNGVLLRGLPYPEPDRLVYIAASLRATIAPTFAYVSDYPAWKHNRTLSRIAGYMGFHANFSGKGDPEWVAGGLATDSLFPLLGVQPILGRNFLAEEDRPGGPPVAILDYAFWQSHFRGSPEAIGTPIALDDKSYTIVGVLPPDFRLPDRYGLGRYDLWVPFAISDNGRARDVLLRVIGRLKPGVNGQAVRSELESLMQPRLRKGLKGTVSVVPWHEQVTGGAKRSLILFLVAVLFVLLIGCVNVANLLLSRGAARHKEVAVRRALGAGRLRIVRQLLTESAVMALLGAALGLVFAYWSKNLLLMVIAPKMPALDPVRLDYRVLLFAVALALLTGIAFGLAPALQVSRVELNETLQESGRGATEGRSSRRFRGALAVVEVALAMVLLSGAGLLLKSFLRLRDIDMGFRSDRVLAFHVSLPASRYPKPMDQARFLEQSLASLTTVPGVQSVGGGSCLPLTGSTTIFGGMTIEGHPGATYDFTGVTVSPGYFRTRGIPLVRGSSFTDADREGAASVVIVNESFVRRFLLNENDLGKRIQNPNRKNDWATIVGVAGDVRPYPAESAAPEIYLPYLQPGEPRITRSGDAFLTFVVRTAGDPLNLVPSLRSRIAGIDKSLPLHGVAPLEELRAQWMAPRRVNMLLIGAFAALALALGSIGIYGVLAYSIGQRRHEIGVRVALGARQAEILGMVLGKGMGLVAAGIGAGLVASLAATRLIASELWGVSPTDPWTLVAVIAVLTLSGLAACLVPARRATKVDPIQALRYE